MSVRPAAVVTFLLLAGFTGLAQPTPPPGQRPPVTFRSEITFVEIDAIVTDGEGRFVPGLTRDDFRVIEDGQPQAITAFSMMHIPVERPPVVHPGRAAVEPDSASNHVPFDGRIFLLLLDDLQTAPSRTSFVRRAARDFIERHVAANDLVAVSFTSGQSMGQDFTASRGRLLAAVDRFTGHKLTSKAAAMIQHEYMTRQVLKTTKPPPRARDPYEIEREVHATTSLRVLERMSEFLSGIRGRRKALVYFGEGIDHELMDVIDPEGLELSDTGSVRAAMRDAVGMATRSNVSVYAIDPRGLATGLEEAIGLPTLTPHFNKDLNPLKMVDELSRSHLWMRSVTGETGGIPFLNTNDTAGPLRRIVDDSSSYYILGYYAPPGRQDGRFRAVDVRVTRPGLEVRARRGYYAPGGGQTERRDTTAGASQELQDALRSPLPVHGLGFSASASAFRSRGREASVVLVVEVDPAQLVFEDRGGSYGTDLELQITATDPLSKTPVRSTHDVAALRLRPETHAVVTREGIRITRRLDLLPGRYRLQFGVRDKTGGAVGTVFSDLDVPDFTRGPLGLSGLLLVSAAATRTPTAEPDPRLAARLPGPHTARREFPVNDTLAVFAEVYGAGLAPSQRPAARTTVLAEDGRVVYVAEQVGGELIPAGEGGAPAAGRWEHHVTIPAAKLGTGRFTLRVEALTRPGAASTVVRELPITIR
jgi:VWFA-related protein